MGAFNVLKARLTCPRCGYTGDVEIEFRFGLLDLHKYAIGDRIEWGEGGLRMPASRPDGGNYRGEGYVECPNGRHDYWVDIDVVEDVITAVHVNPDKKGYIT